MGVTRSCQGIFGRFGDLAASVIQYVNTYIAEILNTLSIYNIVTRRRLYCLSHVINLTTKAFLFSSDPNDFKKEVKITEEEKKDR